MVNKPTDVLLTNVAVAFTTAPPAAGKHTLQGGASVSFWLLEPRCARGRGRWLENALQICLFPISRQTKLSVCIEWEVRVWTPRFLSGSFCSWTQSPRSLTWYHGDRESGLFISMLTLKSQVFFYFFWWVCVIGNRTAVYEQVCTGVWKPSPAQSAVLGMSAWTEKQL